MMISRPSFAAVIAAALIAPALAQEPVEVKPFEIKRLIIGKQLVVDKAFAEKNQVPEPSPFSITIPTGEDFLTLPDTTSGGFLKISFATHDREFLESIHFFDMEVPTNETEKRISSVATAMSGQVFQSVTKDRKDAKVLEIRETEIGTVAAVEVIGRYIDENDGLIYLWIVGLPHPVTKRGTFAISTIHFGRRPMTTDQDFRETLAGRALHSFRYIQ